MGTKNTQKALADETDQLVDTILKSGVDGIIGGFPCTDLSIANSNAAGLAGSRSGLVWEMVRTIRLVRPKYVLMENVVPILYRGIGRILGSLASIGYDSEWDCISSGGVGAPHERERIYILAYPNGNGQQGIEQKPIQRQMPGSIGRSDEFAWCSSFRCVEDLPKRSSLYPSQLCGSANGTAKRLHGIGNGNPPCIIRELTKGLK